MLRCWVRREVLRVSISARERRKEMNVRGAIRSCNCELVKVCFPIDRSLNGGLPCSRRSPLELLELGASEGKASLAACVCPFTQLMREISR